LSLFRRSTQKPVTPPRYYVYVSDAKVDMVLGQIPQSVLSGIAAELKLDLKILGLTLSQKEREENRYSRVAAALEYLDATVEIGTPETPTAYFRATMNMRWGVFGAAAYGRPAAPVVFFGGVRGDLAVALTGSPHHVIGAPPDTEMRKGFASYGIVDPEEYSGALRVDEPEQLDNEARAQGTFTTAEDFLRNIRGPSQPVEFVARVLAKRPRMYGLSGPDPIGDCTDVLLGSPFFVALAESPDDG
jgi:hypothetical protein